MPDIEALYREHRAGLVRLVQRELHDRHDAEDVVQTAFLDAQRALVRGTIPHNPRAWLAAIALNAARRLRRRHVSVEALEEYAVQEASRLPEIKGALAGLPRNEQIAVVYRDLLGLSYAEIATLMGTTVPAVTMLLHRARSRLRSVLGIAVVGFWSSRWLRGSHSYVTAARAAGLVVAGGLATAGVVTARHAVHVTAPAMAGSARGTESTSSDSGRITRPAAVRSRGRRAQGSPSSAAAPMSTPTPTAVQPAQTPPTMMPPHGPRGPWSALTVPTLSAPAPTVAIPTLPTAAATANLRGVTATVGAPPPATLSVPAPVTTVTLPIP